MQYIVLDLEWNQSPIGKVVRNKKASLQYEIIEIGAIKTDENFNPIESFDKFIRPKAYLKFHKAIEKLLPFSMKELKKAKSFEKVIYEFLEWCGNDFCFCTWGEMDLAQLQNNINYYNLNIEFPRPFLYIDLQRVYSEQYLSSTKLASLSEAVENLGIESYGSFHRAICDARYTAKVGTFIDKHLLENRPSIDTFLIPSSQKEEVSIVTDDMEQYLSRGYEDKEKIIFNKKFKNLSCFKCSSQLEKKLSWFSETNKNKYHAVFSCPNCGLIAGGIRLKRFKKSGYYYIRTLKFIDSKEMKKIIKKNEATKVKEEQKKLGIIEKHKESENES